LIAGHFLSRLQLVNTHGALFEAHCDQAAIGTDCRREDLCAHLGWELHVPAGHHLPGRGIPDSHGAVGYPSMRDQSPTVWCETQHPLLYRVQGSDQGAGVHVPDQDFARSELRGCSLAVRTEKSFVEAVLLGIWNGDIT